MSFYFCMKIEDGSHTWFIGRAFISCVFFSRFLKGNLLNRMGCMKSTLAREGVVVHRLGRLGGSSFGAAISFVVRNSVHIRLFFSSLVSRSRSGGSTRPSRLQVVCVYSQKYKIQIRCNCVHAINLPADPWGSGERASNHVM